MKCDNCDRLLATKQDAKDIPPGEGEHLCWGACEPEDWRARALKAEAERDEARQQIDALTLINANLVQYREQAEQTSHACPEPYTFRGGYIEDAAGDRWWSSELLAKVEKERDQLKEELEKLHRLAPTGTYTANATYEMQLLTVKQERNEARAEVERLRRQLPEGMEHCTIRYRECVRGHAWLSALNWIQRGCPTCAERTAAERQREACAKWLLSGIRRGFERDGFGPDELELAEQIIRVCRATPLVTEGDK